MRDAISALATIEAFVYTLAAAASAASTTVSRGLLAEARAAVASVIRRTDDIIAGSTLPDLANLADSLRALNAYAPDAQLAERAADAADILTLHIDLARGAPGRTIVRGGKRIALADRIGRLDMLDLFDDIDTWSELCDADDATIPFAEPVDHPSH